MADGWYNEDWWKKISLPKKPQDYMGKYLAQGVTNEAWDKLSEDDQKSGLYHKSSSGEHIKMQAHKEAVDQRARMAEFEAAQQGASQSFARHGKPFSMSRYKDTSMFPAKSMPVSDPGRLQAAPVGYDKEPWWRQSPYVSPRLPGYSIFSMKPYSW